MLKCILLFLVGCLSINATIAQSCQITGWVKDYFTHKPLDSVEVLLVNRVTDKTVPVEYFWHKVYGYTGQLYSHPDSTKKIAKRTYTNARGYFHIDATIDTPYKVICVYSRFRRGMYAPIYHDLQPYLDSAEIADNAARGIYYIRATCNYDKTKYLEFCPKCQKRDKVIRALGGLPVHDMDGVLRDGEGNELKDFYSLGCDFDFDCHPTKYCKRCDLLF